jgi:tetratricopeptide (TPR) repeat protein
MEALGGILWWLSDLEGAGRVYRETLDLQRELGDPREIANALYNHSLALVYGSSAPEDAVVALDEAESINRELGNVGGLGDVEWARGTYAAASEEDIPSAIEHMKKSIVYYREAGNEFGLGWGLHQVGDMARRIGDFEQAWDCVAQGLVLFAGHRDVSAVVLLLAVAAAIAKALGDEERGYRLAGAFHGLRLASGTEIVAAEANRIEGYEFETLEALVGETAIPYREGRAMNLDQAVAYALRGPVDR